MKYFRSMTMAPNINNPPYDRSVHKYLSSLEILEGVTVTGSRYIINFYWHGVKVCFYSGVSECLPVNPVQSLPWLKICCSQHFSQMEKVEAK